VRLPKPLRTSSFRLTILYAAMFGLSGLVLFAIVAWSVGNFMAQQLDATVANELAEVKADAGGQNTDALKRVIEALTINSPGICYLLQAPDGRVLAGNMTAIEPTPGPRSLDPAHLSPDRHAVGGVRGQGIRLPDGAYLFVGISDHQLGELREVISRTFLLGSSMTILLAVAGGLVMSLGVLRRVEAVSRASRAIMAGDLGRRMTLRGTDDEFDHLNTSLNAMLDRIQALMLGLQEVSSDIAHDLRTPLTRLRQRLELARRREDTVEGLNAALDAAIGNVDAILDTFGALLRIAQVEAGTRRSGFQPVALSILLDGLVEAYQPVAEENAQVLQSDIAPDLWVDGDRELLTQLFANLIDNAIGHSPAGARLSVEAAASPGGIGVVVSDTGPGIPAAFRDKVLQRFYRLETSRTTAGSGLGLSLVSAVVGLHEATLALRDNEPGLRCVLHFRPTADRPFKHHLAIGSGVSPRLGAAPGA
jgi:signal transduction histidine kinase